MMQHLELITDQVFRNQHIALNGKEIRSCEFYDCILETTATDGPSLFVGNYCDNGCKYIGDGWPQVFEWPLPQIRDWPGGSTA